MALIVPFENGTKPKLPAGFAGPSHVLPPIVGDKRVALNKKNLTFFHGAHFYLPLSSPAPSGGSLFPGEHWTSTVAVDVDLPLGCEIVNSSARTKDTDKSNVTALPGAAAGRHRVRVTNHVGGWLGWQVGLGLLFSDRSIEGTTHTVSFRAHTAAGLTATQAMVSAEQQVGTAAGWVQASVAMVARPSFRLPATFSVSYSYINARSFVRQPILS
jgi:hypothetical protein